MRMNEEARVNILAVVTALVVTFVRHGVETKWGPWEAWSSILGGWFIHWIGLLLLTAIIVAAITYWHKMFVGTEVQLFAMRVELQYYIKMTVLVATLAIGFLSLYPVSEDD
jgi:hypothetical protein